GCNPPVNDLFCPDRLVTRAEMAAFLIRALGLESQMPGFQGTFSDVAADEWYTPYVEALADLGITDGYPDGTYRPQASVTRAEMAKFLFLAFGSGSVTSPQGIFIDVPTTEWFALAVEQIYADQITLGCGTDPLSYCPFDVVHRDEMASFIARALGLGG
ncbi:MAG: S-layer homology domain-containing protein, partial [Acidimicrobiia bacterium]